MSEKTFDIKEELKKLPGSPGVYLMHDKHDDIIYVGKAVNLRNRVRSYFRESTPHTAKISKMVSLVERFEYIVTDSETEALVLECNLIKEYSPRYNTMLKDDKTYPYIKVTVGEAFPRIYLSRSMKRDGSRYFGPYTSAGAVKQTITLLRKLYAIRSCQKNLPKDIGKERPCIYYHIHRCDAPCMGYISQEDYAEHVEKVLKFLSGDYDSVLKDLNAQMARAAEALEFEKAAKLRDLITSVNNVARDQKITDFSGDDRDVIGMAAEGDEAVIQTFFVRGGRIIGRDHYHMTRISGMSRPEIMTEFIKQYYLTTPFLPSEILLPEEIADK